MFETIKMKSIFASLLIGLIVCNVSVKSQTLSFALKTSPNISFNFATISDYVNGITQLDAATLNIEAAGLEWDLYVGSTTVSPGMWNVTSTYSLSGTPPPISILLIRARNSSNTSQASVFSALQDISLPTYIIGSSAADASTTCPALGTNTAGNYLSNPNCYQFHIDLKLIPGLTYQAGLYNLRIDYILIQDL